MLPESASSVIAIVIFVVPGLVFEMRRERHRPAVNRTVFCELTQCRRVCKRHAGDGRRHGAGAPPGCRRFVGCRLPSMASIANVLPMCGT